MVRKAFIVPIAALVLAAAGTVPSAALAGKTDRVNVTSEQSGGGGDASAKSERKICKTLANSARRIDNKRLCMTQAEWQKFDEEMEE